MHIHILGICGTFMGSLAILARQLGLRVTGSDAAVYPPMSTQLEEQGIELIEGYDPVQLEPAPDLVVIGNALSRGNPAVEAVLNRGLAYTSGPQFLAEHILPGRWVMAVAGTHGKTTTTAMLSHILEQAGMAPGFLIGGVPKDFGISARLGDTPFFVIEADEYDTAFFDKRSKFVHYHPRTTILNNLEFDHGDIFPDLAAIQRQFHHLVRTIPGDGMILVPKGNESLAEVLSMGCWSDVQYLGGDSEPCDWQVRPLQADCSQFEVLLNGKLQAQVSWQHSGLHNMYNALGAIAAARHVGVLPSLACQALSCFQGVKRRMEQVCDVAGIQVFDDFAHHPSAIATTLAGVRARNPDARIIAVIEPRSNTMRMGQHRDKLAPACADASEVIWYQPEGLSWQLDDVLTKSPVPAQLDQSIDSIVAELVSRSQTGDQIIIMSNGGFGGIHQKLATALKAQYGVIDE